MNLSDVKRNNEKLLRLEAEYFKKEYLELEKIFSNSPSIKSAKANITCGPFGSNLLDSLYVNEGVLIVRPFNLKNLKVENDNLVYISESNIKVNGLKTFPKGSLLFSRVGDIKTGVLNRGIATISPNIIAVDFKDENLSKFLAVFFETEYGYKQIRRQLKISAQPTVSTGIIGNLKIPLVTNDFILAISELVELSFELEEKSRKTYIEAENLLIKEIGLQDFNPNKDSINIKYFSESFGTSGRIDSEFYQKKYDLIEESFDKFKRIKLNQLIKYPISSGVTPKAGGDSYTDSKNGVPFVRAVDLKDGEVITSNFKYIKNEVHNSVLKRTQLEKGDVLLSIAGTVGRSSIFNHDFEANINQAVSIIRFDEILIKRLYLVAFFNSKIGEEYVSKYSRQGVQTNLSLVEVGNLSIPIIDFNKQKKIAEMIEESFDLKKQSEHLLKVAKKAVKIAIEENEENALKYIKTETNE